MIEEHLYRSNLTFGSISHNLPELQENIIKYLHENSRHVFTWTPPHPKQADLYGFHSDGISIHVKVNYLFERKDLHNIDFILLSEVKRTIELEEKLAEICNRYKKDSF